LPVIADQAFLGQRKQAVKAKIDETVGCRGLAIQEVRPGAIGGDIFAPDDGVPEQEHLVPVDDLADAMIIQPVVVA
jgi:hypothetical protein